MTDLRSKFEGLEDVKDILDDYPSIYFSNESQMYVSKKIVSDDSVFYPSWEVTYLNGAWFAFQEQQKKIDAVIKWVEDNKKSITLSEWHGYTSEQYVDADDLLELLND